MFPEKAHCCVISCASHSHCKVRGELGETGRKFGTMNTCDDAIELVALLLMAAVCC